MNPFNTVTPFGRPLPATPRRTGKVAFAACVAVALAVVPRATAQAAPGKSDRTWTDAEAASREDPDFSVQGEYLSAKEDWGLQVVALGDGGFDAYALQGGLPGAGWERGDRRVKMSGVREGAALRLRSSDSRFTAEWSEGSVSIRRDGAPLATVARIERKSPTLGKPAPDGAVVLFDGRSVAAWIDGAVVGRMLKASNAQTKADFGSYNLHLEFLTPYMPHARGQQRGNSGVYHQARYETQVLDSFGLEGRRNECGAIYSVAGPIVNACLPPLSWQTYDVEFTAAVFDEAGVTSAPPRMTVRLNGVLIHDNQELNEPTTAAPQSGPSRTGPLFLQDHGNPVFYRNIWLEPR